MKYLFLMALLAATAFAFVGAVAQANVVVDGDWKLGEADTNPTTGLPPAVDGQASDPTTVDSGPNGYTLGWIPKSAGLTGTYTATVAPSAAAATGSTVAMNFGGNGFYATTTTPCTNTTEMGIEGWFEVPDTSQQCLAYDGNTYRNGMGLYLFGGTIRVLCGGSGSGWGATSTFTPTPNTWFYAAAVFDSGNVSLYINSNSAPTATGTGQRIYPIGASVGFEIGGARDTEGTGATVDRLKGAADEVRVFTWDGINTIFNAATDLEYGQSVAPPQNPGDANGDKQVDINDLTIVLTNYGQTGMVWSQGDFNGDHQVDINDLTIVLTDYGTTYSAGLKGIKAVPEPGTLALIAAGLAGLLAYAWRKRK